MAFDWGFKTTQQFTDDIRDSKSSVGGLVSKLSNLKKNILNTPEKRALYNTTLGNAIQFKKWQISQLVPIGKDKNTGKLKLDFSNWANNWMSNSALGRGINLYRMNLESEYDNDHLTNNFQNKFAIPSNTGLGMRFGNQNYIPSTFGGNNSPDLDSSALLNQMATDTMMMSGVVTSLNDNLLQIEKHQQTITLEERKINVLISKISKAIINKPTIDDNPKKQSSGHEIFGYKVNEEDPYDKQDKDGTNPNLLKNIFKFLKNPKTWFTETLGAKGLLKGKLKIPSLKMFGKSKGLLKGIGKESKVGLRLFENAEKLTPLMKAGGKAIPLMKAGGKAIPLLGEALMVIDGIGGGIDAWNKNKDKQLFDRIGAAQFGAVKGVSKGLLEIPKMAIQLVKGGVEGGARLVGANNFADKMKNYHFGEKWDNTIDKSFDMVNGNETTRKLAQAFPLLGLFMAGGAALTQLPPIEKFLKSPKFLEITKNISDFNNDMKQHYDDILTKTSTFVNNTINKLNNTINSFFENIKNFISNIGTNAISGIKKIFASDKDPLGNGDKALLNMLANGEGTSDAKAKKLGFDSGYDLVLGHGKFGKPEKPLSKMTIGEVLNYQPTLRKNSGRLNSSAVGKYQIIQPTLKRVMKKLGMNENTIFDANTQDKLARHLLNEVGYEKWKSGKLSDNQFMHGVSKVWAPVGDPYKGYKSYYGQRTGIGAIEQKEALQAAKTTVAANTSQPITIPNQTANINPDIVKSNENTSVKNKKTVNTSISKDNRSKQNPIVITRQDTRPLAAAH